MDGKPRGFFATVPANPGISPGEAGAIPGLDSSAKYGIFKSAILNILIKHLCRASKTKRQNENGYHSRPKYYRRVHWAVKLLSKSS